MCPIHTNISKSPAEARVRRVEFDYLRAFAVMLVLCHHAILAYSTFAFINTENPIASSSPVVNELRWPVFDLFVAFNETFFMPLLFFISGIFSLQSLARKGAGKHLGSRFTRLGIPFVIGVLFLIPLAYYPGQLQVSRLTGVDSNFPAFWLTMVRTGFGTAGPLWFLWLLVAFNLLAALLYHAFPLRAALAGKRADMLIGRPVTFFGILLGGLIVAYVPAAIVFGPLRWIGIGPFHAQASRVLPYLFSFLVGIATGGYGVDRSVFRPDGAVAQRWWVWLATGLLSFAVFIALVLASNRARNIPSEFAFALCCGTMLFGVAGLFLRYVRKPVRLLNSLSNNAYGMYVVHYVFVTWLQFLLLRSSLHPGMKGGIVFAGTAIFSWGVVAAIRRIPGVSKCL